MQVSLIQNFVDTIRRLTSIEDQTKALRKSIDLLEGQVYALMVQMARAEANQGNLKENHDSLKETQKGIQDTLSKMAPEIATLQSAMNRLPSGPQNQTLGKRGLG